MKLFDGTFSALEKSLDLRMKRHAVLSSNVANSETPNFRARELNFAGELERALKTKNEELKKTNPKHMDVAGAQSAHIVYDNGGAVGADGNNVDLDIMTGKLSSNGRAYASAAILVSMKVRLIRFAARGGRGGI